MIVGEATGSFNPNHSWLNAKGELKWRAALSYWSRKKRKTEAQHGNWDGVEGVMMKVHWHAVASNFNEIATDGIVCRQDSRNQRFLIFQRDLGDLYRHHNYSPPIVLCQSLVECGLGMDTHQYYSQSGEFPPSSYDERWGNVALWFRTAWFWDIKSYIFSRAWE